MVPGKDVVVVDLFRQWDINCSSMSCVSLSCLLFRCKHEVSCGQSRVHSSTDAYLVSTFQSSPHPPPPVKLQRYFVLYCSGV